MEEELGTSATACAPQRGYRIDYEMSEVSVERTTIDEVAFDDFEIVICYTRL